MAMTHIGAAAICSVLIAAGSLAGQDRATPALTTEDITVAIGNEADARAVFVKVLTHAVGNHDRREFFLAGQIRSEWLPTIPGVEFIRLADTEIAAHLSKSGYYWLVCKVERIDDVVSITLNQGCGRTERDYVVSRDGKEWRLGPPSTRTEGGWVPGTGSGSVGRQPSCSCRNP
jgi:hypothetical protein